MNSLHQEPLSSGKILLVEDNEFNRAVASAMLKRLGFDVSMAENGLVALDAVSRNDFDLIFMDLRMPVMDGFETCESLRQPGSPLPPEVPIIAVTADTMPGVKERCLVTGMNEVLVKPVKLDAFQHCLMKHGLLKEPLQGEGN